MPFVRFRDCTCPEAPHSEPSPEWGDLAGDVVELRPFLDFAGGAEALSAMMKAEADPSLLSQLVGPIYIRRGVIAWNVVDEGGPVPLTLEALEALPWVEAYEIADKADDLYGESVLAPLVKRINRLSANGSTAKPRPRTRTSSPKRR